MRFLNRVYAFVFGYFWLTCPICKEYFGGHESGRYGYKTRIVCKSIDCNVAAAVMTYIETGYVPIKKI